MPKTPRGSQLPKKAPKRTGKRGVRPLDVEADFEVPLSRVADPVEELDRVDPPKGSLLVEQPPKPAVVGDRFEIFYDKPVFARVKDIVTVALICSVPLEHEHERLLPKLVREAYHDVSKRGRKGTTLKDADLPGQYARFFLSADLDGETLTLPAAKLTHCSLTEVQRKGEGSARKVIRWQFRLQVKLSREVAHFAELNLGNQFWLTLEDTQEALFDEEEED